MEKIGDKLRYLIKAFHEKNNYDTFFPTIIDNLHMVTLYNYSGKPEYPFSSRNIDEELLTTNLGSNGYSMLVT